MRFDDIVFACHGDQALPLLADARRVELGGQGCPRVHSRK